MIDPVVLVIRSLVEGVRDGANSCRNSTNPLSANPLRPPHTRAAARLTLRRARQAATQTPQGTNNSTLLTTSGSDDPGPGMLQDAAPACPRLLPGYRKIKRQRRAVEDEQPPENQQHGRRNHRLPDRRPIVASEPDILSNSIPLVVAAVVHGSTIARHHSAKEEPLLTAAIHPMVAVLPPESLSTSLLIILTIPFRFLHKIFEVEHDADFHQAEFSVLIDTQSLHALYIARERAFKSLG